MAPTVSQSLDRLMDAAQSILTDRVQLLKLETEAAVANAVRSAAMAGMGGGFLVVGWLLFLLTSYPLIAQRIGEPAALGSLAALNLVPGVILIAFAHRRGNGERTHHT